MKTPRGQSAAGVWQSQPCRNFLPNKFAGIPILGDDRRDDWPFAAGLGMSVERAERKACEHSYDDHLAGNRCNSVFKREDDFACISRNMVVASPAFRKWRWTFVDHNVQSLGDCIYEVTANLAPGRTFNGLSAPG